MDSPVYESTIYEIRTVAVAPQSPRLSKAAARRVDEPIFC